MKGGKMKKIWTGVGLSSILSLFLVNKVYADLKIPGFQDLIITENLTPGQVVARLINWALAYVIAPLLFIYLVYGGIVYATSAGNEDKTKSGKNIIITAILGIVIIAVAFLLVGWVYNAIVRPVTS
jgi:hypothetical protein